jgi:hypothetical protein
MAGSQSGKSRMRLLGLSIEMSGKAAFAALKSGRNTSCLIAKRFVLRRVPRIKYWISTEPT